MKSHNVRKNLFCLIRRCFLQTSSLTSSSASPLSPLPTISTSSSSFTVQFLVNSCGIPLTSALSVSKKLRIHPRKLQNAQSVLNLFKSHHFSDSDIAKLIQKRPQFLQCRVDDNLTPKIELLVANGFVGQLLPRLIVSNPAILLRALDSHIKPSFAFLKSALGNDDKVVAAIKRSAWLLLVDVKSIMQPNIDFLLKEGVPLDRIAKLILKCPRAIQSQPDRMVYAVNSVKNLGLEPKSSMFIHALGVSITMRESCRRKKFEVMKSLGWSEEEILAAFKRNPYVLSCSEERIRTAIDFFNNTLKLGAQTIVARPELLNYSIDRRIRPRHNVLELLVSHKLIKEDKKSVKSLFHISEEDFLERYITKYADKVPGLLQIYDGPSQGKKIET